MLFNCTCCAAELTAPYFFNGGVYGYTCIKKVNPAAKKNKKQCVEVEVIKVFKNDNSTRQIYRVKIQDKVQDVIVYTSNDNVVSLPNCHQVNGKWYTFI